MYPNNFIILLLKNMGTEKKTFNTPLLQFLAIGILLFGLNYWFNKDDNSDSTIIISKKEMDSYTKMASNGGNLDLDILNKLVEQKINQELIYEYGLSLNLTQSDSKIREQIIEAAQNIILAQAPIGDPGDSILKEYFSKKKSLLSEQIVFYFDQYFFGNDLLAAQQALFLVKEGNTIENMDSLDIPTQISKVGEFEISQQFGVLFIDSLAKQENGWRGIIKSDLGFHVILDYSKKTIEMNLKNSKKEIFNTWKQSEGKLFYTNFLKDLRGKADIKMNTTE
tara:strand:- start:5591 stop:6430 length:840 start_codon:yes stop_codon:yes gene_type:complete